LAICAAAVCARAARQLICIEHTGLRLRHIGKTDPRCGTVQFCFHSGRLTCSARTGFRAVTTPLKCCRRRQWRSGMRRMISRCNVGLPPAPNFPGCPESMPCCPASRQDQLQNAKCPRFQGKVKTQNDENNNGNNSNRFNFYCKVTNVQARRPTNNCHQIAS